MRHYLFILLAVITLLSQWVLVEHAYHEHDSGEVCAVCLVASTHDHAITPNLPAPSIAASFTIGEQLPQQGAGRRTVRHYASRAPPFSL